MSAEQSNPASLNDGIDDDIRAKFERETQAIRERRQAEEEDYVRRYASNGSYTTSNILKCFEEIARGEEALAHVHLKDPYYTDFTTKHNIGTDELIAVRYMTGINLDPSLDEQNDPSKFIRRLLLDLEMLKARFRFLEPDPQGYGIGTLHNVTRLLTSTFGEELPDADVSQTEYKRKVAAERLDLDRLIDDLTQDIPILLRKDELLLALDTGQLLLFALALNLYRARDVLDDSEILFYTRRLIETRSILFRGMATLRAPRIVSQYFYRYIAGASNLLAFVQADLRESPSGTTDERLPFTIFGYEYSRALAQAERRKTEPTSVSSYNDDVLHYGILLGLNDIYSFATPDELAFIARMFPKPFEGTEMPRDVLFHLLAIDNFQDDWQASDGTSDLWCLKLEPRADENPRLTGWNAGSCEEIYSQIEALREGAAVAASAGPASPTPREDEILLSLSQKFRPPEDEDVPPGKSIIILAEGPTALIPFAALTDSSGTFWGTLYPITIVNRFNERTLSPTISPDGLKMGCVISNTFKVAGDMQQKPFLDPLPFSGLEGEFVSKLWGWPLVTERFATVDATLGALRQYSVVHLASHSALDEGPTRFDLKNAVNDPTAFFMAAKTFMDAAAIVLAGPAEDSEAQLSAAVLEQEAWKQSELVVLSICTGSTGKGIGTEAPFSLARAIRLAGTRNVIASMYPIDDEVAYKFSKYFHEALSKQNLLAVALQTAQSNLLESGYRWHSWGGYQLLR